MVRSIASGTGRADDWIGGLKLFFAAGDVGGARAVLPVAVQAQLSGHHVSGLAHGVFHEEGNRDWAWFDLAKSKEFAAQCDVIIYATSVRDMQAVGIAHHASRHGVPCIHVLDNWSSYASRISSFPPDIYAVMDNLA